MQAAAAFDVLRVGGKLARTLAQCICIALLYAWGAVCCLVILMMFATLGRQQSEAPFWVEALFFSIPVILLLALSILNGDIGEHRKTVKLERKRLQSILDDDNRSFQEYLQVYPDACRNCGYRKFHRFSGRKTCQQADEGGTYDYFQPCTMLVCTRCHFCDSKKEPFAFLAVTQPQIFEQFVKANSIQDVSPTSSLPIVTKTSSVLSRTQRRQAERIMPPSY